MAGRLSGPARERRLALIFVAAAAVVLVGAFAVSRVGPSPTLGWRIGLGAVPMNPQSTSLVIEVDHRYCVPTSGGSDEWLGAPDIAYGPTAVTITMHARIDISECVGMYLSGVQVPITLREPLGDRSLLDGSASAPATRYVP